MLVIAQDQSLYAFPPQALWGAQRSWTATSTFARTRGAALTVSMVTRSQAFSSPVGASSMCNNLDLADNCMLGSSSPNPVAAPHQKPEIALGDWDRPLHLILENYQQDPSHTRPGVYGPVLLCFQEVTSSSPFSNALYAANTSPCSDGAWQYVVRTLAGHMLHPGC